MKWAKIITFLAISVVASAQTQPPPPRTARQAVLEMLFGKLPKLFERHIPENALEIFNKIDAGLAPMVIAQFSGLPGELTREGNRRYRRVVGLR